MTAQTDREWIAAASAVELAAAIRHRRFSCVQVVEACLQRIAQVNPRLNAVVQLAPEAALAQAAAADAALGRSAPTGPLHGVPFTVKDTLETAGLPCTSGTIGRASFVPEADATAVARLRSAGGILLGKTNVPELACALETDNLVYGRTNNPYDLARTPGGSTGGEAAIIAAGGSPLGLGTDAGGSIRVPAHFCGLAAIKPTSGRVPRTGQFPPPLGARSAVFHVSLIARRTEDLASALTVISGPDGRDHSILPGGLGEGGDVKLPGLRVAWFADDSVAAPSPAIAACVQEAARCLGAAGAQVEECVPPGAAQALRIYSDISRGDGGDGLRALLARIGSAPISPLLEEALASFFSPRMPDPGKALFAFAEWDGLRNAMTAWMQGYDAVLSPVAPFAALHHGTSFGEEARLGWGYAQLHNLTGWPAVTVRVGTSESGLPIGVQIAARPWHERVALAVAGHLENSFGGWSMPKLDRG
jgi:amidase